MTITHAPRGKTRAKSTYPVSFLSWSEFVDLLPVPYTEAVILKWSREGLFPPGQTFGSRKQPKRWPVSELIEYVTDEYSGYPGVVETFEVAILKRARELAEHRLKNLPGTSTNRTP